MRTMRTIRKLRGISLPLAAALSVSAAGCVASLDGDDADEVTSDGAALTLAEVRSPDGSHYEFIELEEGEIVIVTRHPSVEVAAAAVLRESAESVATFYERLTGEPAPAALVDAELRAQALGAELAAFADPLAELHALEEPQPTSSFSGHAEVASTSSALTYNQFSNTYCAPNQDFLYCFPSIGNAWCEARGLTMEGVVYAKGGGVTVRMRYKTISGWHTHRHEFVPQGQLVQMANAYFLARRWRRFEVLNNHQQHQLYFSCKGTK